MPSPEFRHGCTFSTLVKVFRSHHWAALFGNYQIFNILPNVFASTSWLLSPSSSSKLKDIYTSIIDPHFRYCCAVWGVCGLTEIQNLQKLQNRAARIITDSNYDAPSKPLIETLGWMTIEKVIQRETLVMVFKSVNGLSPQYLSELFVTSSTNACYNLRRTTTDLRLPKKLSSNGQKSFSFRGAALWISLPSESKQASNLLTFKKSIL